MRSWECPSVSYCEMEITNGTYFIISRGLSELLRFFAEVASLVCITVPDMWVALDEHLLNEWKNSMTKYNRRRKCSELKGHVRRTSHPNAGGLSRGRSEGCLEDLRPAGRVGVIQVNEGRWAEWTESCTGVALWFRRRLPVYSGESRAVVAWRGGQWQKCSVSCLLLVVSQIYITDTFQITCTWMQFIV